MPPFSHEDEMNPIHYNSDGYPDDLDLEDGFDEDYDPDEDARYWDQQYEDWLPEDEEEDYYEDERWP